MRNVFYCDQCSRAYSIDHNGVSRHMTKDGNTDFDADAEHVPYGEEYYQDTEDNGNA